MPISDRDYVRGEHPPACTCKECTDKRLGKYFKESQTRKPPKLGMTKTPPSKNISYSKKEFPPVLMPIILIFSCTLIGFGISLFTGTSTPLWVLLTFSIIYSIEKWGKKATVNKAIGIPYKLFLNALVLSVLGYIIWFGIKLFTQSLQFTPVISSLLFIGKLVFFIWLCRVLAKNSWRLPSMKLTVFSLLVITIVFAFAGVEPLSSYKDNLFTSISSYVEEQQSRIEVAEQTVKEARTEAEALAKEAKVEAEEQTIAELVQLIHQLIKIERTTQGLSTLQISSTLTSLAEEHSQEMADYDYFSHDRTPGSQDLDWGVAPGAGRGENIFMMPQQLVIPGPLLSPEELADEIVRGWMGSPGHRENILTSQFTHTGIGIAKDGIYYYITQMFEGQWY